MTLAAGLYDWLLFWLWGYGLIVVLLIVPTWDMVNKPGV